MFSTQFMKDFPFDPPEVNSGEILVETTGYRTAQEQIELMIQAGKRLDDYRHSLYDFDDFESIDETYDDPTRKMDFDRAEAFQLNLESERNIINAKKATDMVLKASQNAQEDLEMDSDKEVDPE